MIFRGKQFCTAFSKKKMFMNTASELFRCIQVHGGAHNRDACWRCWRLFSIIPFFSSIFWLLPRDTWWSTTLMGNVNIWLCGNCVLFLTDFSKVCQTNVLSLDYYQVLSNKNLFHLHNYHRTEEKKMFQSLIIRIEVTNIISLCFFSVSKSKKPI